MAKGKIGPSSQMGNTFRADFKVVRLLADRLVGSDIEFSAELDISDDAEPQEQLKALAGIKRWFTMVLDGCVAFCPGTEVPAATFEALANNFMLTPDDPYDHLLLMLLAAKINAIGGDTLSVAHCHITSDQSDGFGNWFEGDPDDVLPSHEQWVGKHAYYDKPWWHRSDGSMIDVWAGPDDDLSQKPDILLDIWEDMFQTTAEVDENAEPAEIIRPNFKPTIVRDD